MTLKQKLQNLLNSQGIVTLDQLEQFCHTEHFKLATAERTLRPSSMPGIERITKNGAIIAYQQKPVTCCYSYGIFKTHDSHCATLQQKPVDKLF